MGILVGVKLYMMDLASMIQYSASQSLAAVVGKQMLTPSSKFEKGQRPEVCTESSAHATKASEPYLD